MLKIIERFRKVNYFSRNFSMCQILLEEDTKTYKRKVKETVELVTLVDQDDKILGLKPKVESQKLAKKLNMTLERVYDTKYGKMYPAYKMFSAADLLKADIKSNSKALKKLPLNSRISDHDLVTKIKTIKKWLSKNCEVHITILSNNDPEALMKKVYTKVEEELKNESRILDVRHKEESLKFIILPPKVPQINVAKSKQEKDDTDDA